MQHRPWPTEAELGNLCAWLARPTPPLLAGVKLRAVPRLESLVRPGVADPGIRAALGAAILEWRRETPDAALFSFWDASYPALLRQIAHPPLALFARGDLQHLRAGIVAIVGARAASPSACAFTAELAGDLARCGVVVASGLARGIDEAAHRGALDAGGGSIAVQGCGPDLCYPPEHAALAQRIAAQGCVLTELPPGTPPRAWHFPRRNRILAGIAAGVVVVQAEPKSGALVTARHAIDEAREVMAVPGDVADPRSVGPHALLRDGAALVDGAAAVLAALRWKPCPAGDAGESAQLLALLDRPASASELCQALHWDAARFQRVVSTLELAGLLERIAGNRWQRRPQ